MVTVRNVSKAYGPHTVIDDVSVDIPRGRVTSIIGPNGAGKSTLLGMLSRLIPADRGEILLEGTPITRFRSEEFARRLALLKQANHINLRLTVRDLVSFGRFPHSQGRLTATDRAHVHQALCYMSLEDIADKHLDELSGGQKQRAFFAMVLAQDTDYILLDEPLNNLDMRHSVQIMQTLRAMVTELDKTVIIVLHDINFASVYSDYIVALKDGRVARAGPTHEIIDEGVLRGIYDMDIEIQPVNGNRICVYFAAPGLCPAAERLAATRERSAASGTLRT